MHTCCHTKFKQKFKIKIKNDIGCMFNWCVEQSYQISTILKMNHAMKTPFKHNSVQHMRTPEHRQTKPHIMVKLIEDLIFLDLLNELGEKEKKNAWLAEHFDAFLQQV